MGTGHDPIVGSQTVREALLSTINSDLEEIFSRLEALEAGGLSGIAIASQAEAEAGTDNSKMMTALRVSEAIAYRTADFPSVSGAATISGTWTFTTSPVVPVATSGDHAVRKAQLDSLSNELSSLAAMNVRALEVKTDSFACSAGYTYAVRNTAAITATLPASPSPGDSVTLMDVTGTASTHNVTVDPNGERILGQTESLVIDTDYATVMLVYVDATTGWAIR